MFSLLRKCSHETGGNIRECGNVLDNVEMFSLLRKCIHETGVSAEFAEMFSNVLVKPAERFP